MALIPDQNTTLNKINTVQLSENEDTLRFLEQVSNIFKEKSEVSDEPRGYLGMSSLADPCMRKLWYGFHFASPKEVTSEKTRRIFNTGHIAEGFVYKDLMKIGCEVSEAQAACVAVVGHLRGHIDGKILGVVEAPLTKHLLEIKTMNDKNFKEISKKGVESAKPIHYGQMQIYMKHQKLSRALYIAYNKNTSEYYIERVYYDKDYAQRLEARGAEVIMSEKPPVKEFSPSWYACKFCKHKGVCHEGDEPERNCRTCIDSDICSDGKWECSVSGKELTIKEQLAGCELYKKGWGL